MSNTETQIKMDAYKNEVERNFQKHLIAEERDLLIIELAKRLELHGDERFKNFFNAKS